MLQAIAMCAVVVDKCEASKPLIKLGSVIKNSKNSPFLWPVLYKCITAMSTNIVYPSPVPLFQDIISAQIVARAVASANRVLG